MDGLFVVWEAVVIVNSDLMLAMKDGLTIQFSLIFANILNAVAKHLSDKPHVQIVEKCYKGNDELRVDWSIVNDSCAVTKGFGEELSTLHISP